MRYADNFRSRPPVLQWKWSKSAAEEEEEEAGRRTKEVSSEAATTIVERWADMLWLGPAP